MASKKLYQVGLVPFLSLPSPTSLRWLLSTSSNLLWWPLSTSGIIFLLTLQRSPVVTWCYTWYQSKVPSTKSHRKKTPIRFDFLEAMEATVTTTEATLVTLALLGE
jgi:hypothetical protein